MENHLNAALFFLQSIEKKKRKKGNQLVARNKFFGIELHTCIEGICLLVASTSHFVMWTQFTIDLDLFYCARLCTAIDMCSVYYTPLLGSIGNSFHGS